MTYEALLDALDFDKVIQAMRDTGIKQCDQEDACVMVLRALKRWGPNDFLGLDISGIEERFSVQFLGPNAGIRSISTDVTSEEALGQGEHSLKGFVDLVGTRNAKDGPLRTVIDWKTTGSISAEQQQRLRDSWQGRLYALAYGAQRIEYRTVNREGRCIELVLPWPGEYEERDVVQHYGYALGLRDLFSGGPVWMRHAPYACKAYGRDCPYRDLCSHNQAPRKAPEARPLSYSSCETLLLCPERYRLDSVLKLDDNKEDTALGTAFHAGVAQAWRQIKEMQR